MTTGEVGAVCFGVVIGWIAYRTLRRNDQPVRMSDLATVIGAVGGGAVTAIFNSQDLFGCYAIGLAGGFFAYLLLAATVLKGVDWLGD